MELNEENELRNRLTKQNGELIADETIKVFKKHQQEIEDLIDKSKKSLKKLEEEFESYVKSRIVPIVAVIITLFLAGIISIVYLGSKDVNNSVISLQKDIISAQNVIRSSTDELQNARLNITGFLSTLEETNKKLGLAQRAYIEEKSKYEDLKKEVEILLKKLKK